MTKLEVCRDRRDGMQDSNFNVVFGKGVAVWIVYFMGVAE